jgi:thioredoxin-related protein
MMARILGGLLCFGVMCETHLEEFHLSLVAKLFTSTEFRLTMLFIEEPVTSRPDGKKTYSFNGLACEVSQRFPGPNGDKNPLLEPEPVAASTIAIPWKSYAEGRKESSANNRPLLLLFDGRDKWTRKFKEETLADPTISRILREKMVCILLDAVEDQILADAMRVSAYPTINFAGSEGKILGTIEGYQTVEKFRESLLRCQYQVSLENEKTKKEIEQKKALEKIEAPAPIRWRDYKSGRQEAQKLHRLMLIYVNSNRAEKKAFISSQTVKFVSERFVPVYVDAAEEPQLSEKLGILAYPKIAVAHPDGRVLGVMEEYLDPATFERDIRDLISGDRSLKLTLPPPSDPKPDTEQSPF